MAVVAALLLGTAGAAKADLFVSGSIFTDSGTSSPTSFSQSVTLAPGTYSLDGGALSLDLSIVPAGAGDEWLVFNYTTVGGVPLSCDGCDWSLYQTGLQAAVPVTSSLPT